MEKQASKILHPSAFIPDTISFDKLMNIAVKYFSVTEITKDGYYAGKICTGINAIDNTESKRSPFIEAFCSVLLSLIWDKAITIYMMSLLRGFMIYTP